MSSPTTPSSWPLPPPPSSPPSRWARLSAWFSALSRGAKAGVIAGAATVFLCTCCGGLGAIGAALPATTTQGHLTAPTATHAPSGKGTVTAAPAGTATPAPKATATPQPKPTSTPAPTATQPPRPTAPPAAINGNPWGYTFTNTGHILTSPVAQFCDGTYFHCVSSFYTSANGYVVQCNNGLFSHSGGVRNACSRDGGEGPAVYQP